MILEICANSIESAINADKAGADRIELCSSLNVGGLTPSYGLIKTVLDAVTIPVYVLIRPRTGNFVYTNDEIEIIKLDIAACKELGVTGVVCGFLDKDDAIDTILTERILELIRPMKFTFHRAFDLVRNPWDAMENLINLQIESILTSGTAYRALDGLATLKLLNEKANGRIEIIPAGGINSENIKDFKNAGFRVVHSSASSNTETNFNSNLFGNQKRTFSDYEKIRAMVINKN